MPVKSISEKTDRRLSALRHDASGIALTEFAIALPMLLALVLYGVETAHYVIAVMRVNQISSMVADNAARVRDSISEADVNELLTGAKLIGDSLNFTTRGRVVISSVEPNGQTGALKGQWIRWQRCIGTLNTPASQPAYGAQNKGKVDATLQYMGKSTRKIAASDSSAMIFVEATYNYQPLISNSLLGAQVIRSETVFNVRERTDQEIKAAAGFTASVCTLYAS